MGDTHQTPLGYHLPKTSLMESAEAHLVFDDPEDWFYLGGTICPQALPGRTGEVGSGLATIFQHAQADADRAVAFRPVTLPFERVCFAGMAFKQASIGDLTVVSGVAGSMLEAQPFVRRADEFIIF
jgi:hypothetical protein